MSYDPEIDFTQAFWRYLFGIDREAEGATLQPLWASFCRAFEHYADPPDVDEFRADLLKKHRQFLEHHSEFFEVPADLVGPLEAACNDV